MDHVPLAALASGRAPASADSRAMMNRPLSVMNLDLTEAESAALLRPAVIREGQLHPSKPTNPPTRSIVSSVLKHKVAALQPAARGKRREAGSQLRGRP